MAVRPPCTRPPMSGRGHGRAADSLLGRTNHSLISSRWFLPPRSPHPGPLRRAGPAGLHPGVQHALPVHRRVRGVRHGGWARSGGRAGAPYGRRTSPEAREPCHPKSHPGTPYGLRTPCVLTTSHNLPSSIVRSPCGAPPPSPMQGASLVGLTARVPLVAEAAESQVRDF